MDKILSTPKQQLGQFYTKNTDYILQEFDEFIKAKNITDPFAGAGDLLKWAKAGKANSVIGYDIDKSKNDNKLIFYNDSLQNPKKIRIYINESTVPLSKQNEG